MPTPHRLPVAAWLLPVVVLALAFAFQGSRGLFSTDEGRYTAVALEMLDSGDWLTPRLHPQIEHFTKPPLAYWAVAASLTAFGRSEWAARAPNALAWALTVWLVYLAMLRLRPERAAAAAVVYLSCALPYLAANYLNADTLLTLYTTSAGVALVWAVTGRGAQCPAAALFWIASGLAFLVKGPPALLGPAALALAAATAAGDALPGHDRWLRPWGPALFLAVAAPWFVAMELRHPGLLISLLDQEVFRRVATDFHGKHPGWRGLLTAYAPVALLGTLPWWPWLARRAWRARRRPLSHWRARQEIWLPALWLLLPLPGFLLAQSRLPLYLLPLFVPFAMLVALSLPDDWLRHRRRLAAWLGLWLALLVGVRGLPLLFDLRMDDRALARDFRQAVPEPVEEIVFVEIGPRFGLRFYLEVPVVQTTLAATGDARIPALSRWLDRRPVCRAFVLKREDLPRWRRWTTAHSLAVEARGGQDKLAFLVADDEACGPG